MEQNINMVINCGWADEVKRFYCLTHLTYLSHVKSCMRNLCRPANRNLSSVLLKVQNLLLVTWDFNGIFSKKTGDSGEPKRLLFIKILASLGFSTPAPPYGIYLKKLMRVVLWLIETKTTAKDKKTWLSKHFILST